MDADIDRHLDRVKRHTAAMGKRGRPRLARDKVVNGGVKLHPMTIRSLDRIARQANITRSELVRHALGSFLAANPNGYSLFAVTE